jgi:hypothetical protein
VGPLPAQISVGVARASASLQTTLLTIANVVRFTQATRKTQEYISVSDITDWTFSKKAKLARRTHNQNRNRDYHHEGREEHEVKKLNCNNFPNPSCPSCASW